MVIRKEVREMDDPQIDLSRLKLARKELNLSLREVAEITGYESAATISRIEAGKRGIKSTLLKKLSTLYGKPIDYFFVD